MDYSSVYQYQITLEMSGKQGNQGIWTMPLFRGLSGDAIHIGITLYKNMFFQNHTVSQSIANQ